MTEDFFIEDAYKGQLDVEGLLLMHMNRIAIYRDTDIKRYCSGVETFILVCPRNVREKALDYLKSIGLTRGHYSAVTEEILIKYDDLLIYIHEQLEKQHMIWKKRSVKTFE